MHSNCLSICVLLTDEQDKGSTLAYSLYTFLAPVMLGLVGRLRSSGIPGVA